MTHPRWKTMDIPDVPDPGATRPPMRVDLDLLGDAFESEHHEELRSRKPDESLIPMQIGTPVAAPERQAARPTWIYVILGVLIFVSLGAMFSSSLLAGILLLFS